MSCGKGTCAHLCYLMSMCYASTQRIEDLEAYVKQLEEKIESVHGSASASGQRSGSRSQRSPRRRSKPEPKGFPGSGGRVVPRPIRNYAFPSNGDSSHR